MADELFDIVDDNDQVIGQAPRSACHGNPSLIHRVAHVLVCNAQGDLLLQKRSFKKDVQPGKWDTSVGGHLAPGESYLEAARREMEEELGVAGQPLTFLYHSRIRNDYEAENVGTFWTCHEGPFQAPVDEIVEVRFWRPAEIDAALGTGVLTPNFEEEWSLYQNWLKCYISPGDRVPGLCGGDSMPNLVTSGALDS